MKPDLNLLVVFDAIARFGSVSMAATHLSLSQPAVSHALNRLRKTVGDPLFTRAGRGFIATPRATEMTEPVRALILAAQDLASPSQFVAGSTERAFRVAASDYAAQTLVPTLMRLLRHEAPGLSLDILPATGSIPDNLSSGQLDLSFWGTNPLGPPFHHTDLFYEHYEGVACVHHPMFCSGVAVDLDAYLTYPHAVVALQAPGANAIDHTLRAVGRPRRIALSSHSFVGNLAALPGSDLICSLPARMCQTLEPGLRRFALPVAIPSYGYGIVWHDRSHGSAPTYGCVMLSIAPLLCLELHAHLRQPQWPPILGKSGATQTMVINALIINGSDPGAVPGDSTNSPFHLGRVGSK